MRLRFASFTGLLLAVALLPGCGKEAEDAGKDSVGSAASASPKSKEASASKKTGADASAGEVGEAAVSKDCPKSLTGRDTVSRVITKECGVVPVTGDYRIDGATLTLEAGSTLAFSHDVGLYVGYMKSAKLVVQGTKEEPVTFTSAGDKSPGAWKGVRLYKNAKRSTIEGLVLEYAGDKKGALLIEAEDVSFSGSTFRKLKEPNVVVDGKASLSGFSGNSFESEGRAALRLTPDTVGSLGEGNQFPKESRVEVEGGTLSESASWRALDVPYLMLGRVRVQGSDGSRAKLSIESGATLEFDGDASLSVGYAGEGTLATSGTAEKPVVFTASEKKAPGGWAGVHVHGKGEAELEGALFEYGGAKKDQGVLFVDRGSVAISSSTFRNNVMGLVMRHHKSATQRIEKNTFSDNETAIRLQADQLSDLAGDNSYSGKSLVVVEGGRVLRDGTWAKQEGALVEFSGRLNLSGGVIQIAPGANFQLADGVKIDVGYSDRGSIEAKGTAEAPIVFRGSRDEVGSWESIIFHGKANGNVLEHVKLLNAGGKAGLIFKGKSSGTLADVTCEKCEAEAVDAHKNAKLEQTGVKKL